MPEKQLIFPKYPLKTRVQIKFGQDTIIGYVKKIGIAPKDHIARKPGSLIYLIQIVAINNQRVAGNLVTTAGEQEIILFNQTK